MVLNALKKVAALALLGTIFWKYQPVERARLQERKNLREERDKFEVMIRSQNYDPLSTINIGSQPKDSTE